MSRKETEEAIEEARRGGLKRFDSVDTLFADLSQHPIKSRVLHFILETASEYPARGAAESDDCCVRQRGAPTAPPE